ncbi:MAG: DUF4411 family protein [Peptococcaceae bacterium]|nr:DUF4411 family protein [Peptococcaceae bacterium]
MQAFDASSMIYAWDNYPHDQFPKLWEWMANQISEGTLQMSEVAVEEVRHKAPECNSWLRNNDFQIISVDNAILQESYRIKGLLEIEEDNYGRGVDENDLIIIATAKILNCELVTDEGFQANLPTHKYNYKIPAVCTMETVNVSWINFLRYLKRQGVIFG